MKQLYFNICLWSLSLIICVSLFIISIKCNKQITTNNLTYNCNKNNLPQSCGNTNLTEPFEPYDGSYTNGFSIKNVLCSNLDVSKSLNTTADITSSGNITLYNLTKEKPNKNDETKSISLTKEGNIKCNNITCTQHIGNFDVQGKITGSSLQLAKDAVTYNIQNTNDINTGRNVNVGGEIVLNDINKIKIKAQTLLQVLYPVGSIYMSMNSTDPSTFIGGKWTLIHDRFLWCTNYSGTEGGSFSVTLSTENLPPHNHKLQIYRTSSESPRNYGLSDESGFGGRVMVGSYGDTFSTSNTGSGESFSILPPYKAVYCWYRTE